MKHLGDITAISGYVALPVDVVIGGSPCQDLSVAGKRAGLAGARSGLFMHQVRVVKELRNADIRRGRTGQFIRPRFMVWEQVPGAFSSNKGEDFRAALQEIIRIAEPDAPDVPLPPKGKWPLADCWMGDGWSVSYRVLDAQFWGVPQRRRRIALVADFGGHAAPEILFVRESVCGDPAPGGAPGKTIAAGIEKGTGAAAALRMRSGREGGGKGALVQIEKSGTLLKNYNDQAIFAFDARGNGDGKTVCTMTGDHQNRVTDYTALVMATGQAGAEITRDASPTLNCNHEQPIVATAGCLTPWDIQSRRIAGADGTSQTLYSKGKSGGAEGQTVFAESVVRRLTPLECERLQGYPDGWTDIGPWTDSSGKLHRESSDSARYRALGNSIALPPWKWVLKRLCACYERDATMGSLFDGIGGFPLIWERLNGPGTCLWASEIEEFPIAVTKRRFGGEA